MRWGKTSDRDILMLQKRVNGTWIDVTLVSKGNASNVCRNNAKRDKIPYRVRNMSKNPPTIYCESHPK